MLCMLHHYKLLIITDAPLLVTTVDAPFAIDAPKVVTAMTVELSIQQYILFY